jgi:nucleoside triphosphate diphosphatase
MMNKPKYWLIHFYWFIFFTLTCVHKFRSRFGFIEDELAKQGKTAETSSLEEMDALWEQAKQHE